MVSGCSRMNRIEETIDQSISQMDNYLIEVEKETARLKERLEDLYQNQTRYDLSIEKMDVENGGQYSFYQGDRYYKTSENGMTSICLGMKMKDYTEPKRRIRLMEVIEPELKEFAGNYHSVSILCENYVTLFYPPWDIISLIPPNLDYTQFFWYYIVDPAHNPDRKTLWTGEPFAQLAYGEWVKDSVAPVYEGDQFRGIATLSVNLTALGTDILNHSRFPLILMTDHAKVIAANRTAVDRFQINVLGKVKFYEQMRNNTFMDQSYQLTWNDYPADIRNLGERLVKEEQFQLKINSVDYLVIRKKLKVQEDLMIAAIVSLNE